MGIEMDLNGGRGGNKVPVGGSKLDKGKGENQVPVMGNKQDQCNRGSEAPIMSMRNVSVNDSSNVDRERRLMVVGSYVDDEMVVEWESVERLCVIIRVLTVLMTMELVMLGYVVSLCDVLQEHMYYTRDRVVYGAEVDGGVTSARLPDGGIGGISTADGLNDGVFRRERGGDLELGEEIESELSERIHNEFEHGSNQD